jgi:integrase
MSTKKTKKAKEPVTIRFKKLKGGNQSVYFDIYRDGNRTYEFPKLYIVPEKNETDKEKNRKTLELANKLKSRMILEMDNVEHGFTNDGEKQKSNFITYLKELTEKSNTEDTKSTYYSYRALTKHLINYKGKTTTFRQVTKDYCKGFTEYLKTAKNGTYEGKKLSEGSQFGYSGLLAVVLNMAMKDEYLAANPMGKLTRHERPKEPDSKTEYLTIEEIKMLVKTPCAKPIVKQAFLFTCYSGLRFSDVKKLTWGDIQKDNDGKNIVRYKQKKVKQYEYLQVSDDALNYLPDRNGGADESTIFRLSQNGYTNGTLAGWTLAAGIKKHVTFHVSRHTNATLLLSLGVPIETVSKLLGHSDIKTTQRYAKVVDASKREAVSKLDGII